MQQRAKNRLTTLWWTAFVLMWLLERAYLRSYSGDVMTTDSFRNVAILSLLSAIGGVLTELFDWRAFFVVQVVQRISDFQHTPLPVQSSSD